MDRQGRQEPPARKAPLDQRVLQEPKVLWVLPEPPAHKAPQGRPDLKDLLEPKVLWVQRELLARKDPLDQRERTVRTVSP